MLPHTYIDVLVILFEGATFGIQFEDLPHSGYHQPSGGFRQFPQNRHFRPNRQSPMGWDVFAIIASPMVVSHASVLRNSSFSSLP